jgi:REP element-mobilizing transposase RayT
VFSTRGREPWIRGEWDSRLYAYVGGIAHAEKCQLLAAGGMPDHVHFLISMARTIAVADLMRLIKANSSKWIHETFSGQPFAWQNGYGAFAVGHDQVDSVRAYIARQAEHHARHSYQEEYRTLLAEHGLEWDENYVWD